jgi:ankyrin repeat protein
MGTQYSAYEGYINNLSWINYMKLSDLPPLSYDQILPLKNCHLLMAYYGYIDYPEYKEKENITDNFGANALLIAVSRGHIELFKHLLAIGYDRDFTNINGTNALLISAYRGQLDMFKYLLSIGYDINYINNVGRDLRNLAKPIIKNYIMEKYPEVLMNYAELYTRLVSRETEKLDIVDFKEDNCSICLDKIHKSQKVFMCNNNHSIHAECFGRFILTKRGWANCYCGSKYKTKMFLVK